MADQQPPQLPDGNGLPPATSSNEEAPKEESKNPPSRMNKAELQAENAELKEKLAVLEDLDLDKLKAIMEGADAPTEPDPHTPRGMVEERAPRSSMAEGDALRGDDSRSTRRQIGATRVLDADFYADKMPDKQLMWVNNVNGEVNKWIDAGAEPVEALNKTTRIYEGINDSFDFRYVRAVGGTYSGQDFWVYLLAMDKKLYHEVKIAPLRERQRAINEALYRGRNQSKGAGDQPYSKAGIGGSNTYAPQLPTGDGTGLIQTVGPQPNIQDAL